MNYKTCQALNKNFALNEKSIPYFVGGGEKAVVTDGMEKGYIYAALYFFDEVAKEIAKLDKMVRKVLEEVKMDAPAIEPAVLMVEASRRIKDIIGDDGLDALIKQIIGEESKHLSLLPDKIELEKYEKVCDAIFVELVTGVYQKTIVGAERQPDGTMVTALSQKYIDTMTERQKKLFSPALRMVAFLNGLRLDNFSSTPEFKITFMPEKLKKSFDEQEDIIKEKLKKLMAEHTE